MSIIHDALQKIQKNRATISKRPMQTKNTMTFMRVLSMLAVCVLLSGVAMFVYVRPETKPPVTVAVKKVNFHLNGIIISDKTRIALINHQAYYVGDRIDELQIVAISHDGVQFQGKDNTFMLRSLA